jgi:CubicO group peptidase (beta-lactamase class C family)
MLRIWSSVYIIVCSFSLVYAQAPRSALTPAQIATIDTFVSAEMASQHIPGLQVGVYSRGKILLAKGYGLANVELNVPVKPESIFQSGSVGKQFVSAAIMMLVEQGKLSLDDSITKYFPDAPAAWKPILLKNLLSHTSGLADYEDAAAFNDPTSPFYVRLDFTENQLMTKFYHLAIENPPGDKWAYRNANYAILGILIHRVAGMFYGDFLAERIFRPLGMSQTRIISDRDIVPNRAAGYELDEQGQLKNQVWVSPTFNSTADGTLYFNVLDIARWDAALYTTQLLKNSSLDRIWTVYPLNDGKPNPAGYGFAWMIGTQLGHKRIQHSGAWQGFTCIIARYPDDGISVAVLTNLDSGHSNPSYFAHVIAGLADQPLLPERFTAIPDTTAARTALLSAILTDINTSKDFSSEAAPSLAALMKDGVPPAIKQMVASVWPNGTITLLRQTPIPGSGGGRGLYRVTSGEQAILVRFAITDDGKISTLGFYPSHEYDD